MLARCSLAPSRASFTAEDVYGSNFDFTFTQEEDGILALSATMDALNAHSPVPTGAGPDGTDQFFIGIEFDDTSEIPVVAAVGGEHFVAGWDQCDVDCLAGVAILGVDETKTFASFTVDDGSDKPPPGGVKVKGFVTKTVEADDGRWGGCIVQLDKNLADYGLDCPGKWVSFSCSGVYAEKEVAYRMFTQAQMALARGRKVEIVVDDTKKHNEYCYGNQIAVKK